MPNFDDPFGTPNKPAVNGDFDFEFDDMDDDLPEPGDYEATVLEVEGQDSKSSGQPMLVWDFRVKGVDSSVRYWTSLSPTAKWKVVETCSALGIKPDPETKKLAFNRAAVIGKKCTVTLEHRDYEGRKTLSIKRVKAYVPSNEQEFEGVRPVDNSL